MTGNINKVFIFIAGTTSIACAFIAIILLKLFADVPIFAVLFLVMWGHGILMAYFGATILCKDLIKGVNLDDLLPEGKSALKVRGKIIFNKKRLLSISLKLDTIELESEDQIKEEEKDE